MKFAIDALLLSPFFDSLRSSILKFQNNKQFPNVGELNQKLIIERIKFVAQADKRGDFSSGYEPRIFEKGEVQTRENSWHDFFNALVWNQFPNTKKTINSLHYKFQRQRFPDKQRLPAENMLTLFDENGVIVISQDQELLDLIRQHQWQTLFWEKRDALKNYLHVYVFGHGLCEKLLHPYIGITAKALLFHHREVSSIDDLAAQFILENKKDLSPTTLSPLPILGIPGWWQDNEEETFYSNKDYFRDKRV